jgi:hypothetical protein
MFIILLPLAFGIVFLDMVGLQQTGKLRQNGWRVAFLQASLLTGVFIVLQSELLSLIKALAQPWVALSWFFALLASLWFGLKQGLLLAGLRSMNKTIRSMEWIEIIFGVCLGAVAALILLVALLAIPNNTDSLLYHMARVVHWAEDHSLAHYPVAFQPQLLNPIGAELVILNLRLLWGNDQFANLVQWFSMFASLIGVSALAAMLGAGRKGQIAAAAFTVSLPMGILQASSTQNDYVAALWLICLAVFVLLAVRQLFGWIELLCLAASLGLGLLTKGTFYPYAFPLGVWLIIHWLRQRNLALFLKRGAVIVLVVLVLNLGYWVRNTITYGGPLGSEEWISSMTSGGRGLIPFAGQLVENTALNFATPSKAVNLWLRTAVRQTFKASFPGIRGFQLVWGWNHEDRAGNPLHMLLVPLTMIALLALAGLGRIKGREVLWYSLAVIGSFCALTLVVHYDQYGVRYQVPFFVAWAPVFGVVLAKVGERRLAPLVSFLFLLIALPWVFLNTSRPLIAVRNTPEKFAIRSLPFISGTMTGSVLAADPKTILFANWPALQKPYSAMTQAVLATDCKEVGLRIDSHDMEYAFWWLLGAPQNGMRLQVVSYPDNLARYADPSFKPCAIICTTCSDRTHLNGLDLSATFAQMKLFLGNTYDPDENK